MIKQIVIKKLATFTNEVKISDLRPINFFYGGNGSGKTSISKLIASSDAYPDCKLEWDGNIRLKTIVFNEDFVNKYFYQSDNFPGIFTIGEGAKEIEEQIRVNKNEVDRLTKDLESLNNTLISKNNEKDNLWNKFKEDCWDKIYHKYQNKFDKIFSGYKNSKEKLAKKILDTNVNPSQQLANIENLKERYSLLFEKQLDKIEKLSLLNESVITKGKEIENNEILKTKIIGKQDVDIAKMIHKLQNHDWVRKGKEYYDKNYDEESKSYICPFCQQSTSDEFRKQLEDYFDESYNSQIESLGKIISDYENISLQIEKYFEELYKITENKYLSEKYDLMKDKSDLIKEKIISNKILLQSKKDNPSSSVELTSIEELLIAFNTLVEEINKKIDEHNSLIDNKGNEKVKLESEIWQYFIDDISNTISSYLENKQNVEAALQNIQSQISTKNETLNSLNNEISELEKQIKSVKPTVDQINKLLQGFGFRGFKLKPTDDDKRYVIIREDGTPAKETLSEGERNFIVFLYFYSLLQGVLNPEENITEDRIVVFDDPVSSLDSEVLFIVSTLIKKLLENIRVNKGNIKQVFILTHNAYFHKEITFINSREQNNNRNDTKYFIVRKINNISQIDSFDTNPIKTTYQLLWDELKKDSIDCIGLQNAMRRIIEFYFNTLANLKEDELIEKFEDQAEKNICRSLIAWINIGSHEVFDDLNFIPTNESIEKYKEVFKRIFEITGHTSHYNMMMGINE